MILPFFEKYVHSLIIKKQINLELNAEEMASINSICVGIMEKSQFPADFEFIGREDSDDED
jgi:hypothetical protein